MELINDFQKTLLCIAVEKESIEIIKLILTYPEIEINQLEILNQSF